MKGIRSRTGWILTVTIAAALFIGGMTAGNILSGWGDLSVGGPVLAGPAITDEQDDSTLPNAIEKVIPAVVYIQSKRIVKQEVRSPLSDNPLFRDFFDDLLRRYNVPREREQQYLGSGVIISTDGYILTNNHLVQDAEEVEVLLPDKRKFDAEVVGTDPRSDVAVLKIDGKDLPAVPKGKSSDLRLGQTVLAIGYPYAVGQTVTRGIVSALGRSLGLVNYEDFIQTDAAINPGNSGGALININGELVGINTAIYSRSGGNQGIGFAIPIELAGRIMDSLVEHGRVVRGYVGVVPQDLDPEMSEFFDLKDTGGVLISTVAEDSPAEKAGFKQGDVVILFDGKKIEDSNEFRRLAAEKEPGSKIDVVVLRDGKKKTLTVTLAERPDSGVAEREDHIDDKSPLFLGVGLENLTNEYRDALNLPPDVKGVVITDIDPSAPAGKAGLSRGDVIVQLNRVMVKDLSEFRDVVKKSRDDKALLLVYRGGGYQYVLIRAK